MSDTRAEPEQTPEPTQRPDLWLPPAAVGPTAGPSTWRQPPAWRDVEDRREPDTWCEPEALSSPGASPPPSAAQARPVRSSVLDRWPVRSRLRSRPWTRVRRVLQLVAVLPLLVGLVVAALTGNHGTGSSSSSRRTSAPTSTVPTVWDVTAVRLRPDLANPAFESAMDGSFRTVYVTQRGGTWLTLTGTSEDGALVLHGLDPATGSVRWQRALDGALCTTEGPADGSVLCASVLQRDPTTGLGTRWQLHLLDPDTGVDRLTRDVDGWFTAVHWTGQTYVGLEQREPAPHAVVRAFAASDLHELWARDLGDEPDAAEMFSTDRIVYRTDPRPGLALDRPRLRDVGHGLLALWAGERTAFIDGRDGRLVMMPHCSRLVDDGDRLWCNEVDGASAYTYGGRLLVRVHGPRLAFPDDDDVGVDVDRPVFLDDDGAAVSVNPKTGNVGQAYTPPGRGSAFGNGTMPSAATVDGHTFLVGGAGAMLLDPGADRVEWRVPSITLTDLPVPLDEHTVLLGAGDLTEVDLRTGATGAELRPGATYAVSVEDRVAGVGLDELSLLTI